MTGLESTIDHSVNQDALGVDAVRMVVEETVSQMARYFLVVLV